MGRNIYLRYIGGRYVFRKRVPTALAEHLGRREFVLSLGRCSFSEARRTALALALEIDELASEAIMSSSIDRRRLEDIARAWFSDSVKGFRKTWDSQTAFDPKNVSDTISQTDASREQWQQMLGQKTFEPFLVNAAREIFERRGINLLPESEDSVLATQLIARAAIEICRYKVALLKGDMTYRVGDEFFTKPPEDGTISSPLFSEALQRYIEEKSHKGDWRPEMVRDIEYLKRLLTGLIGDRALAGYSRSDFSHFCQLLQSLPKNTGKSAQLRGLTPKEMVELAARDSSIPCLSAKTVSKHMANLSGFMKWATKQGFCTENIAAEIYSKPKTKRASEERDAWSPDDLRRLFTSPIYQGAKSRHFWREPGKVITRNARYWAPLLAAFHPLRLEEIAQLRIVDIKEEDGVTYLDIHDRAPLEEQHYKLPPRKLKSKAALRLMPLHPLVLELGFIQHAIKSAAAKSPLIFPELKPYGAGKRLGGKLSKDFPLLFQSLGLNLQFHGLRHTSSTALKRAGVHPDIIDQLSGHEIQGMRGRYGKPLGLQELHQAISAIQYPGIEVGIFIGTGNNDT